jgi:hypothetical protein
MKYTNQILFGDVDIRGLVSTNKYLRPATILFTLPVAVFGLIAFSCALPFAATMDFGRYLKYNYHHQVRLYHRTNGIIEMVASLTKDKQLRAITCKQLIDMI